MDADLEEVRRQVLEQMEGTREVSDEQLRMKISVQTGKYGQEHLLSLQERMKMEKQVFDSLRRLDVLQELMDYVDVTEVMVNGSGHIFYERAGSLYLWDKHFSSRERLEGVIQQIAAYTNKTVNEAEPIADTRLADGSRVNIILPPASLEGPCITIRKFAQNPVTLQRLVELSSISEEIRKVMELLVSAGYNIFVSGGTGSGKTTFLNALSGAIPENERVVTIEDSAELQLFGVKNLVRLEARSTNANGVGEITIRDLIRTSLRLRPDRILVGEVRGPEALELLQANNTGHDGGMSTGHGNSCKDMLSRLETMVLMGMDLPLPAVRGQIASGIDILVHLGRMRDRSRKVLQICEMDGVHGGEIQLHSLYQFEEEMENPETGTKIANYITKQDGEGVYKQPVTGIWKRVGTLKNREKLRQKGVEVRLDEIYGNEEASEQTGKTSAQ